MNEVIIFVFCNFMDFSNNKFKIKSVGTKNFFKCVRNLLYGSHVIHHSHVTGEIKGYEHKFCNKMLRNSQNLIPVFVHNLLSFDFFFVLKGIRLCVWQTKQPSIGGNNLTNLRYANIYCHVKLKDTIKYYQQSLLYLAKNANENGKINIRHTCRKFIEKNDTYSCLFNSLSEGNNNWVLDYLCGGKGLIPYEIIKTFDDVDCAPEGESFTKTEFYSSLRNKIINNEDYENVKDFW